MCVRKYLRQFKTYKVIVAILTKFDVHVDPPFYSESLPHIMNFTNIVMPYQLQ